MHKSVYDTSDESDKDVIDDDSIERFFLSEYKISEKKDKDDSA